MCRPPFLFLPRPFLPILIFFFFFFVASSIGPSGDDRRAGELYQAHLGDSF